jgi:hypothetical protein
MPQLAVTQDSPGEDAYYALEVEYHLPCDIRHGRDYYASPVDYYTEPLPGGRLDFFIADRSNLSAYRAGDPFLAYLVAEDLSDNHVVFHMPQIEDYFVVLSAAEHHGLDTFADVTVRLWRAEAVGAEPVPLVAELLPPAPNPFNPGTRLAFTIARPGPVSLSIYDARGALLRRLVDEELPEGRHERIWDGRDAAGGLLASGVYLARLECDGRSAGRKLVLVK